jgi:hypothetical protein
VSSQHDQAGSGGTGPDGTASRVSSAKGPAWRTRADGSTVFQMSMPVAGWWAWVVFAAVCLADLALQGHDRASLNAAIAIVAVTGFVYACALRPKVIADEGGITVLNPIRDYRVPWGAVKGIYLGDSVELQCARPEPKGHKTVYSWALYTRRRARARAELRTQRWNRRMSAGGSAGYGRRPGEARDLAQTAPAELMARELGRLRDQARERGAGGGAVAGRWAWLPIAAMIVPTIALVLAILVN